MPSTITRRTYRIMMAACLALLASGILAAFTVDDDADTEVAGLDDGADGTDGTDDDGTASDPPGAATPDDADDGTGDGDDANPDGDPDLGGGSDAPTTTGGEGVGGAEGTTTTTAAPSTTAPATTQPGTPSVTPVAAGTYEYDTEGTSSFGTSTSDMPAITTLTVTAADGNGRQVHVRDTRANDGRGSVTRTSFRYAAEGVYLERLEIETYLGPTTSQKTILEPTATFLLIPAGAKGGSSTSGRLEGGGLIADVTLAVHEVGATTSTATLTVKLSGDAQGTQTTDLVTRNSDRMTISEKVNSDVRSGPFQIKSNYTATLRQ